MWILLKYILRSYTPESRCFVYDKQVLNAKHLILCGGKANDI